MGWIGVDLDGTLAHYDGWTSADRIGPPVPLMLQRVRDWLAAGCEVRIFTARACDPAAVPHVHAWLERHGLPLLMVTNVKDYAMTELWDDRAVQVIRNTGRRADGG
jgi:hypothetical protein